MTQVLVLRDAETEIELFHMLTSHFDPLQLLAAQCPSSPRTRYVSAQAVVTGTSSSLQLERKDLGKDAGRIALSLRMSLSGIF